MLISGTVALTATAILFVLGGITDGSRRFGLAINIVSCISLGSAAIYTILYFAKENS